VLDDGVKGADAACQVVDTWRGDELVVESYKAGRLGVAQVKLEVNDLTAFDPEIFCDKIGERAEVPVF